MTKDLTAFHLAPFSETEISILEVTTTDFEADLFLYDTEAQEFPEFYLICKIRYQGDRIQTIELVEIDIRDRASQFFLSPKSWYNKLLSKNAFH